MEYKYWLPDRHSGFIEKTTDCNSLIIIGANGAGKSKLGAWIEYKDKGTVHRIGAQRSLNFKENLALKTYSEAENLVLYGTNSPGEVERNDKGHRWGYYETNFTTTLINDFDNVLAALLAYDNNEKSNFYKACKAAEVKGEKHPETSETISDKLCNVWSAIFPQRKLVIEDSKFHAVLDKDDGQVKYSANQMSDGERAVLYLTSQVLCVPENKTLIIDEPEVHLHPSIMNKLWLLLEGYRKDCLFIYITHDIRFASMHNSSDKIWIKDYDGHNWTFEKIESSELPEDLLFEVLGSRKNVLFVEGEKNSYDTKLYSEIYPNYHVVPCGSCTQVIARTKAFRNNSSLHNCKVYGIIDRDYRSEHEIEKYREDGIFTLNVAEIENLFIVEELVRLIAQYVGEDADTVFHNVEQYVVEVRFQNQIAKQVCQSVVSEIKYRLSSIEISNKAEDKAKESLDDALSSINYNAIKEEREKLFNDILEEKDYAHVLSAFNEKNLSSSIGRFFGIDNKSYCLKVIRFLQGEKHDEIINALVSYLPSVEDIPR